ncbi:beta-1,6-galactofuranosyltransferase [Pedobacter quisquiliarum]|uniref:Beta-1,6-galactofuranosyltransferase n=1 Tax=Pedobacter quisquiliarum TaxID=1834438 RepID=A0A916U9V5_9SPHI|nr:hypothetical protein [Pedobacter quisquiliarum]GGC65188.1 beta-1,6-galactofuranosyltransferase [Pedobacter quisquiliarum]
MKYQLRMFYADAGNQTAGSKATSDCAEILSRDGFKAFEVPIYMNKGAIPNMLIMLRHFFMLFSRLKSSDTILLQYPLLGINKYLRQIVQLLGKKGCKKVCLIHDLDSLRLVHHAWTLEEEISRLNAFDTVIVHNGEMKALLEAKGLRTEIRCLELFDYLVPANVLQEIQAKAIQATVQGNTAGSSADAVQPKTVAFAGNLGKSEFVSRLKELQGIRFNLYGPGFKAETSSDDIRWLGSFDPNELPAKLEGSFGLIWDGEHIENCGGNLGNYLRYNNPHKASLYLVSNLPVIAPEHSAIGKFIRAHGIGITVDSLLDLPQALNAVDDAAYQQMKMKLGAISKRIAAGGFLSTQVQQL